MRLALRGTSLSERAVVRGQLAAERELATGGITLSRLAVLASGQADDPAAEVQLGRRSAPRCAAPTAMSRRSPARSWFWS
ncbi:hypothetical protein XAC3562_1200057 [Xanthomonas citri pv. citri]|uniref:Uncharacterized protein n=2 Tax=Xanthomonas TaxID=338 RepID=A0A0U5FAP4_XANCI|nr:hypothetical protein XAC3608_2050008 [Xanthomonas citri pv. citri]CEG14734.1 hypothetical protein XAC3562_1200057 [Xanthomonas citri pv. citri]SOO23735.1 hypothetical protein XFF6991_30055 [Xanthomonas phaseoli pv. phaseoli]